MVCIIIDQDNIVFLQVEIKTAFRTSERSHTSSYFFGCYAVHPCQSDGSNTVLYVYFYRNPQLDIGNTDIRAYEIEPNLTITDTDVFGMEIGFFS